MSLTARGEISNGLARSIARIDHHLYTRSHVNGHTTQTTTTRSLWVATTDLPQTVAHPFYRQ